MSFNLNLLKNIEDTKNDFTPEELSRMNKKGIYSLWDLQCETVESLTKMNLSGSITKIIRVLEDNDLSLQLHQGNSNILKGLTNNGVNCLKKLDSKLFEKNSKSMAVIKKLVERYFEYKSQKAFSVKKMDGINAKIREEKIAEEMNAYERIVFEKQAETNEASNPISRLDEKMKSINIKFHHDPNCFKKKNEFVR